MQNWDKLRRWVMLGIGSALLTLALTTDHGNMQIEGFFFALLIGSASWVMLHFAIAKVVGPLLFGRIWCGWACWFGMIFDWLPYPHPRYRIPGLIGKLRYAHFALSALTVVLVWAGLSAQGVVGDSGMVWFVAGLAGYYLIGIAMALALKDNRAFCKYLCPLGVLMKSTARFALLKIDGKAALCDGCDVCVEMCPMNIRISDYILNHQRVLSSECTLCQTCIHVCPTKALGLSLKLDAGGVEHMDYVPPRSVRTPHANTKRESRSQGDFSEHQPGG